MLDGLYIKVGIYVITTRVCLRFLRSSSDGMHGHDALDASCGTTMTLMCSYSGIRV